MLHNAYMIRKLDAKKVHDSLLQKWLRVYVLRDFFLKFSVTGNVTI